MNSILSYIREFFSNVDKVLLGGCSLFAALLITLNYRLGIETKWLYDAAGWCRFGGFYALYAIAFIIPWLLLIARRKIGLRASGFGPQTSDFGLQTPGLFWFLLFTAPAIFALKVSFPGLSGWLLPALNAPWGKYYSIASSLPSRLVLVAIPLALLWWWQRPQPSFWGLSTRNFTWKPYALMLLIMVPVIAFASTQNDFLAAYPKLKQVSFIAPYVHHSWPYKLLYEFSYGLDFVTIELFFRGFLVIAFVRYAGPDAIMPMAVFYCSIHFGKPLFECISSFFGGMLLGIVAYRTKSILGGFMVHLGIAWMMELGGYIGNIIKR